MIQEKEHNGVVFSCEVFPPKRDDDIYQIYKTLDEIKALKPDFISVTYGAGGSNSKKTATIGIYSEYLRRRGTCTYDSGRYGRSESSCIAV